MSALTEGSKFAKIAALVMFLTLLLHMISMGAPDWAKSDPSQTEREEKIGLWRYCTKPLNGGQVCNIFVDIRTGDWIRAAQGFSILALFSMMGAMAVVALLAFVPDYEDDSRIWIAAVAITGVSALFKLIEVGTMGATYQEYFSTKDPDVWGNVGMLSWAFGVACASLALCVVTVILLVLERSEGKEAY